jgi:hypothetical protein
MRVRATEREYHWSIFEYGTGAMVCEDQIGETHQFTDLPDLPVGEYQLEVRTTEGASGMKLLRVVAWSSLGPGEPVHRRHTVQGGRFSMCGAHLFPENG